VSTRHRGLIGAVLVILGVALVAGPLALHAARQHAVAPAASAPPLTGAEQAALERDRSVVASLPRALSQVPAAMVDAARSKSGTPLDRAQAIGLLSAHPELAALYGAVEAPHAIAGPLARGLGSPTQSVGAPTLGLGDLLIFFGVPGLLLVLVGMLLRTRAATPLPGVGLVMVLVAGALVLTGVFAPLDNGTSVWSGAASATRGTGTVTAQSVEQSLARLQQVYDDIVPALQTAGAAGRQVLDPQSAAQRIATDRHLGALNQFVTNFSALYGAGILITQKLDSTPSGASSSPSLRWLAWPGLPVGLGLLGASGAVILRRRRSAPSIVHRPSDDLVMSSLSPGSP
jgi:hypothetical protein